MVAVKVAELGLDGLRADSAVGGVAVAGRVAHLLVGLRAEGEHSADAEFQLLPRCAEIEAAGVRRDGGAEEVAVVVRLVEVGGRGDLRVRTEPELVESRVGGYPGVFPAEDRPGRVAFHVAVLRGYPALGDGLIFQNLVEVVGEVDGCAYCPVLFLEQFAIDRDLHAVVHDVGCVEVDIGESCRALDGRGCDHVRAEAVVIFSVHREPVLPDAEVQAYLRVLGLLPSEVGVRGRRDSAEVESLVAEVAVLLLEVLHHKQVGGAGVHVARETVGGPEGSVRELRNGFPDPFLLAKVPGRPRAPCRVELPVASEVGAAVGTERRVKDDRLSEIVVRRGVERGVAGLAEIFPVEFLDLPHPFVLRAAD